MVDSCWATECVHTPLAASGPQTASMKSFMIWSKKVEFQFVAGLLAVQSGGVSSGTTSRGFGHQKVVMIDQLVDVAVTGQLCAVHYSGNLK